LFLGIYLAIGNLPLAVGFALAIGIGQLALAKWRRRLETMQWLSLALVITLGAATLVTNDSRFMMAKPSLIHFAIGAVMLRPGWLDRYMPPIVKEHLPKGALRLAGFAWAGLMFLLGLINLYLPRTSAQSFGAISLLSAQPAPRSSRSLSSISCFAF